MSETKKQKDPKLLIKSNALYDALQHFAQITLPALGTLYFTLSQLWGLPSGAEVVGTITAIDAFLGVMLKISNIQYTNSDEQYDGTMDVVKNTKRDTTQFQLNLNGDPHELKNKDVVTFKVKVSESDRK